MSDQTVFATCSPRGVLMQAMTGRGLLSDGKEEERVSVRALPRMPAGALDSTFHIGAVVCPPTPV